jgi:hypothetical protein
VAVSPTSATVAPTKTQQFTATVSYAASNAVTWQVNGAAGGDATHGTISAAGLYTAPTTTPSPATVSVTAVAQADTTKSATASVQISASGDTTVPTAPPNLTATAVGSTEIDLSWTASTDNVGVTGYSIEKCTGTGCSAFSLLTTTGGATTSYKATGLLSGTTYGFRVRAQDAAANFSSYSNVAVGVTGSAGDIQKPSQPTGLTATAASSTQINLLWTASTDNVGVTGYKVERCSGGGCSAFAQVGTTGGSTVAFSDTGLTASTSYSYRVRATDAAGNLSTYSNIASAATAGSGGSSITVSVSPRRGGLTVTQTLGVTATLTNDTTNAGVSWSSSGGGSFSACSAPCASVTFTAPAAAGVVTITATSVADGTKTASSTIGVTDLGSVSTYLNANSRQGVNVKEFALATSGPTAVNSTNFGKLFSCSVDAAIYAQPLWVANLAIGGGTHNVVFVATEHDTLYAFDADANPCSTLWQKSLLPAGQTWVTSTDASCSDLTPNIGIVGTPVIDVSGKTLYVVTKSKTTSGTVTFHQQLHAIDITTGSEKFSGPQEITATASGSGGGSSGGTLTFDPLLQNQRSALLLVSGHVVIAWASHCDFGQYHGWLMSYNATTLTQEAVWNSSPNGVLNGIWMSGSGPAADSSGNIYLATGNGTFDANNASAPNNDYGDSIVKLGLPAGNTFPVLSYFTPFNQASLEGGDVDQGSGGVLLLPDVTSGSYLVQAGKDGNIYLADRVNGLGGFHSSSNNTAQEVSGQLPGGIWGSPSYWNGNIYFGAAVDGSGTTTDPIRAFSFDAGGTGKISSTPTSHTTRNFGFSGPTSSVSASGTSNGVLWALDNFQWQVSCASAATCQHLYAYDATNLATLLYTDSSSNNGSGAVKFTVPTVANGKVYAGGQNTLTVYGLLP